MKNVKFGNGCVFAVSNDDKAISLDRIFGLNCGCNSQDSGTPPEASWPAVVCYDNKRCEGKHFILRKFDIGSEEAVISFQSNDGILKLDINYRHDRHARMISCKCRLTNLGGKVISVRRVFPRFIFSPGKYQVYSQLSLWCNENIGSWHELNGVDVELKSAPGRSSCGNTPFCVLKDMDTGRAVGFHVIPRGNWQINVFSRFTSNEMPKAVVELGLSDTDLQYELAPGEGLDLPEILIQEVPEGDITRAAPLLHRYCLDKDFPKLNLHLPPVLYNTWLYRFSDFKEEQLRKQLDAAAYIGCEIFVVDAGWAGENDIGWGVGNWKEKTERAFCGNMRDFAAEVRAKGLGFGLWMEPERFPADVPLRREHPEWFPENSERIDLTIPEAAEYFYDSIARLVEKYSLKFMKTDMNVSLGYDASGRELYSYCTVWRGIMEKLKANYPDFIIENCAGGALRTDLNTAQFFDTQFISDNANPGAALRTFQGTVLRLPPGRLQRWCVMRAAPENLTPIVADLKNVLVPWTATWMELEQASLDFALGSVLAGIPGFSGDLAGLETEYLDRAAEYVRFYKKHREELVNAVAHLLAPADRLQCESDWTVIQLHHEETDKSIVLAYNDPSTHLATRMIKMRNLDPKAEYSVKQVFPKPTEEIVVNGSELMENGIEISLQFSMFFRHNSGVWQIGKKARA